MAATKNRNGPTDCGPLLCRSTVSSPPSCFSVLGGQNKTRKCNNHCLVTVFSAMILKQIGWGRLCLNGHWMHSYFTEVWLCEEGMWFLMQIVVQRLQFINQGLHLRPILLLFDVIQPVIEVFAKWHNDNHKTKLTKTWNPSKFLFLLHWPDTVGHLTNTSGFQAKH